eukprot:scaffold4537_cov144-Isochrysis_galbana.AAC.1
MWRSECGVWAPAPARVALLAIPPPPLTIQEILRLLRSRSALLELVSVSASQPAPAYPMSRTAVWLTRAGHCWVWAEARLITHSALRGAGRGCACGSSE